MGSWGGGRTWRRSGRTRLGTGGHPMKLGNLLMAGAVVTLIFGLSLVLIPVALFSLYGITVTDAGIVLARLFGAAFLGFTVLNWSARNAADSEVLRGIVLANLLMDAVGFVVTLLGQL